MNRKFYLFEFEYGDRIKEKAFIKDLLKNFDDDVLTGCGIAVNNNPYNLEFLLFLVLSKDIEQFENFINENYSTKKRVVNHFLEDVIESFFKRGYNIYTFVNEDDVDVAITEDSNAIFIYPIKQELNKIWPTKEDRMKEIRKKVFLSYASEDKNTINLIFNELQKNQIKVWYDKYEIEPGDSIIDKLNDGLKNSDLGIICMSKSFLKKNWPKKELNYFLRKGIEQDKKALIVLNLDAEHQDFPELIQEYKYINYKEKDSLDTLSEVLKKL